MYALPVSSEVLHLHSVSVSKNNLDHLLWIEPFWDADIMGYIPVNERTVPSSSMKLEAHVFICWQTIKVKPNGLPFENKEIRMQILEL